MAYKFITQPPCGTPDEPSQTSQVRLRLRLVCSRIQITILINNLRPSNTHAARTHTHMYACIQAHTLPHTHRGTHTLHIQLQLVLQVSFPQRLTTFCSSVCCVSVCVCLCVCMSWCALVCACVCALCVRELLWHTNSIRKPTPTINKFLKNETHRTARALFLIYFSSLQFFFRQQQFFCICFYGCCYCCD